MKKGTYKGDSKKIVTDAGEEILVRHGFGTATYGNPFFQYTGQWVDGEKHGEGEFMMGDGDTYKGSFVNGEIEGYGSRTFANGTQYSGEFHRGEFFGQGMFASKDGTKYEGGWKNNKWDGSGELELANGDIYRGGFMKHKMEGEGSYTWNDGTEYIGEWQNGEQHGQGVLAMSNGDVYDGPFSNNLPHGDGNWTSQCTALEYQGIWAQGVPTEMSTVMLMRTFKPPELEEEESKVKSVKRKTSAGKGTNAKGGGKKLVEVEEEVVGKPRTLQQLIFWNDDKRKVTDVQIVFTNADEDEEDEEESKIPVAGYIKTEPGFFLPFFAICLVDEDGNPREAESGRVIRIRLKKPEVKKEEVDDPKGKGKKAGKKKLVKQHQ